MEKPIKTCGIFLFNGTEILLCHPTGASPAHWSIPKGLQDEGESILETALREFEEEVGVALKDNVATSFLTMGQKIYKNKHKELNGFLSFCNINVPEKFVCSSMTKYGYPEVDIIKWVPIRAALEIMNSSQKELLLEFLTKYSANTEYNNFINILKNKISEN